MMGNGGQRLFRPVSVSPPDGRYDLADVECVCVCVCVCQRETEREGGKKRERDREREISLPIHNSSEMLLDPSYIFIHSFNKYMLNTYFALSILRVGYIPEFFI